MNALIASSATGGHIYPALAVAEGIMKRDAGAEILFVGAKWEIGKDIVRTAGYRQAFIDVSGFDRRNLLKNIGVLAGLVKASSEINAILREFCPDVCIGTGGHVAGPVVRAAKRAGVRTMIQEQNVVPGVANKLAERYADRIFVGFEETALRFQGKDKVVVSGNPVRADFADAAARQGEMRAKYGIAEGAFCVLFFGGSQGAPAINGAAADAVMRLGDGFHFILITGRDYYSGVMERLGGRARDGLTVMGYSDEIYELFAAADLIVSRAGALTVTEIAHSGKASILVPSPYVTNNHQYYNAKTLADAGAAALFSEEELTGKEGGSGKLAAEIERLAADTGAVAAMGRAAAGSVRADAVKVIVDEVFGNK